MTFVSFFPFFDIQTYHFSWSLTEIEKLQYYYHYYCYFPIPKCKGGEEEGVKFHFWINLWTALSLKNFLNFKKVINSNGYQWLLLNNVLKLWLRSRWLPYPVVFISHSNRSAYSTVPRFIIDCNKKRNCAKRCLFGGDLVKCQKCGY